MDPKILSSKFSEDIFEQITEHLIGYEFTKDTRSISIGNSSKYMTNIKNVGYYADLELQVLIIKHASENDARVGLSKELFSLLKQYSINNAIIATYSDGESWRYSLLTTNLNISDKGRVTREFSNPKRHSYLLGPRAKITTPYKYLIKDGKIKNFDDLLDRFSVEVVNDAFYKEIAKLYDELVGVDEQVGVLKYPDQGDASHQFAVRLIGRIVFCWFLREKQSSDGTLLISKKVLSRESSKSGNYYHTVLAPLFFQILNQPINRRSDKFKSGDFGKIPYLNGGLFAPQDDDHYKFDEVTELSVSGLVNVPDDWLHKLLDLLELYNFTVDENTSVDIDLSIDPEMLGRIFENLLARLNPETGETVRQATGSFYTPRDVVEFMVDQALVEYLTHTTKVEKTSLIALVSFSLEDDKQYPLDDAQKLEVVKALNYIRILDPACGSGAFPIGILQKVVFILQQVDPEAKLWFENQIANTIPEVRHLIEREFEHKNYDYIRKLGIIRESIFGIDIQPIATEIARLRCFLTLIVDERIDDNEPNRGVYPLPNLDFKFVTANSLLPLGARISDESEQTGLFEDQSGISELKRLRDEYFNSHNSVRETLKFKFSQAQNKMLQKIISSNSKGLAETTQKLSSWDPFSNIATDWFDSEWMFGIHGFDIVIANPPYGVSVRNNYRDKATKHLGKVPDYEIYYYFIELANKLLLPGGTMSYIIPNTILFNVYAAKYRLKILKEWSIDLLLDCTAFKLFESATIHNAILVFTKSPIGKIVGYKMTRQAVSFGELSTQDTLHMPVELLAENNTNWGLAFKLPQEILELVKTVKKMPNKIGNIFPEFSQGLIAYDKYRGQSAEIIKNRAYHYSEKIKPELKEWLKGEDVTPYSVKWNGKEYIDYCSGIANPRDPKFFKGRRLLVREITNPKIYAGITDAELYHDPAIIVVLENENDINPLEAILNSKLATFYHFNASPKASKGSFPKILVRDIQEFPLPSWDSVSVLIPLVKKRAELTDENAKRLLGEEIDRLVYKIYNLNNDQIKIIESSIIS